MHIKFKTRNSIYHTAEKDGVYYTTKLEELADSGYNAIGQARKNTSAHIVVGERAWFGGGQESWSTSTVQEIIEQESLDPRKKKYAIDELSTIYHQTVVDIYSKYSSPGKQLTPTERCILMGEQHIPIKESVNEVCQTDKISHVFDFSEYETEPSRDDAKIDAAKKELSTTYTSIKDIVGLGDEENALSILKEFREYCNGLLKE